MYEDVDRISPMPQKEKVSVKNTQNKLITANKTPKDVSVTDIPDDAMEVDEQQFESLIPTKASEEEVQSEFHKVDTAPSQGLLTDIYEKTEIAKEKTPDEDIK